MKIPLLIFLSFFILHNAFTQEKKDTIVVKTKNKVHMTISQINELNYSNDKKLLFKSNGWEDSGYSYSGGLTISWAINKYFSLGTGLIVENFYFKKFIIDYNYNKSKIIQNKFLFIGLQIIPDFFYTWKKASFHFIPEIRENLLIKDNFKYFWSDGTQETLTGFYNKSILILACPKIGISYNIYKRFSLSAYFGIKYTLLPINTMYFGYKTSFYSLTGSLGINYRF